MTRSAPPRLLYALVRPPASVGWGLAALAGLSAAGLLAWALQGAGPQPWPAALGLLLWLALAAGAWRCWQRWLQGRLEWDGAQWWLHRPLPAAPLPGQPQVCWDGQDFLLLCFAGPGRRRNWLWLSRASAPALWGDLRRTVYWRPGPAQHA